MQYDIPPVVCYLFGSHRVYRLGEMLTLGTPALAWCERVKGRMLPTPFSWRLDDLLLTELSLVPCSYDEKRAVWAAYKAGEL